MYYHLGEKESVLELAGEVPRKHGVLFVCGPDHAEWAEAFDLQVITVGSSQCAKRYFLDDNALILDLEALRAEDGKRWLRKEFLVRICGAEGVDHVRDLVEFMLSLPHPWAFIEATGER